MTRERPLDGRRVLITSGPTREYLDPVRYLSNPSTGTMGFALAAAARRRGADVTVVSGPTALAAPAGVRVVKVTTARQMLRETLRRVRRAVLVIGAAAVSDWRFSATARHKVKRGPGPLLVTLLPNPDIIKAAAARRRPGQIFVGFALETRRETAEARRKLTAKGLDFVVSNGARTLASLRTRASLVSRDGRRSLPAGTKVSVARAIVAEAERRLARI